MCLQESQWNQEFYESNKYTNGEVILAFVMGCCILNLWKITVNENESGCSVRGLCIGTIANYIRRAHALERELL